ncbi:hypothetical protein Pmani_017992 [Petrolisthes manimaculis]|uniref:FGGY carbohydrate kinase domain-containing protein n=1 Tax=Petrolisthes manimaculis TaxID=1843537 RepID=A0AAE1PLW5_9EUCA|nr:hypothetical protein Pmani_017992 [Petrolisthes manimaculis]
MAEAHYVGVDVGTSSVRAGLVKRGGHMLAIHTVPITVGNPAANFYEQDSEEIWAAVCQAVKVVTSGLSDKSVVRGIGFDATCSLVVLDHDLRPVTISPNTGKDNFNIIMWMDHRAKDQAFYINSQQHKVLKYVGGKVSLEMQSPKLLWLKVHMEDTWKRAAHFLDLPDYLTLKASGSLSRSLCSVVCKWTYQCDGSTQGWDHSFFKSIGLEDLAQDNWKKIGQKVVAPGTSCGVLTAAAAEQMGLVRTTQVATSIIDAHAGGLGLVATQATTSDDFVGRLALICGTSTCHMCVSQDPIFCQGVWGPYLSAMVPGCWLNEAGQSASGSLVDHIIKTHPAANKCTTGKNVYQWLEELLAVMAKEEKLSDPTLLTRDFHLYPDFHGNRSPIADPTMKGMISGLTLDASDRNLALLYLAAIQALAYGTRQIIEQLTSNGHNITSLLMCGGLSKSPIFAQTHADALGMKVLIPQAQAPVLLGASILAAAASGDYPDVTSAALAMADTAPSCLPHQELTRYHDRKYQVFKKMQADQEAYCQLMLNE